MKRLLIFLILPVQLIFAQQKTSLDDCRQWARENHPVLKQKQLLKEMSDLALENNKVNYLPELNLNGQATYQSDVPGIDISMPGINIPKVSKDQYKMYVDFSQTIWDGGITKMLDDLENKKLDSDLQKVEIELYAIQEKVNRFFFLQLKLQQSLRMLDTKKEILLERQKMLVSGVNNGVILVSELDQLKAELIRLKQEQLGLESNAEYCRKALSILTGKEKETFAELAIPKKEYQNIDDITRPELELFGKQKNLLATSSELMKKQRNPKVFGFGQVGYGKPGLNMLSNDFDAYYLVGVGIKWNIHDWKKTKRNTQNLELQKEMIATNEDNFNRNIRLAVENYKQETERLKKVMEQDVELISLQENITKSSASKLNHGTITVSDYIEDLNAEILAKITCETHKIQLEETVEAIRFILGNL